MWWFGYHHAPLGWKRCLEKLSGLEFELSPKVIILTTLGQEFMTWG